MPHKVSYDVLLGPTNDRFGLRATKPSEAIIISDNLSSDFNSIQVTPDPNISETKKVYEVSEYGQHTSIACNTTDLNITDVYLDGKPLFYKVVKKIKGYASLEVDSTDNILVDSNFIYIDKDSANIKYLKSDGGIIYSERAEVLPVFIWEGMLHLSEVTNLDGRTFSYTAENEGARLMIRIKGTGIHAEPKSGTVFDVCSLGNLKFELKPFTYSSVREINGSRVEFVYDYSKVLPNIRTVMRDQGEVLDREYLHLNNANIIKDSFKLKVLDPKKNNQDALYLGIDDIDSVVSLSVEDGTFSKSNINSTNGTINIENILKEYDLDPLEYVFVSEYRCVELPNNFIQLTPETIALRNKKVVFYISPTTIRQPGSEVESKPSLSYTIFERDGSIIKTIDENIPLYEFSLVVKKGWGEDAYSAHGYSGVTDEVADEVVIDGQTSVSGSDESGWSDGGYSSGPFGGSFIRTINDVRKLLEARENSQLGNISIAEIDFYAEIRRSNIFFNKTLSSLKSYPVQKLHNFGAAVFRFSIDGNYSNVNLASGISEISKMAGINLDGQVVNRGSTIDLEFDIRSISKFMDGIGAYDGSLLAVDPEILEAVDSYSNVDVDASISLDSLRLYCLCEDDSIIEVDSVLGYTASADLSSFYVSLPSEMSGKKVGLGLLNSGKSIYPSTFIAV